MKTTTIKISDEFELANGEVIYSAVAAEIAGAKQFAVIHVTDPHQSGVYLFHDAEKWHAVNQNDYSYQRADRVAVITGEWDEEEIGSLDCLACFLGDGILNTTKGRTKPDAAAYVIDAEDLPDLQKQFGADLHVLWEE
jgi:uncharacterized protein YcbK (DUF882 family)